MALLNPVVEEEEDGWFGEGSAFDSGEDLAAALMNLAGVPVSRATAVEEPAGSVFEQEMRSKDMIFELLTPAGSGAASASLEGTAPARKWSDDQALTWTVREPGSMSLPARKPGKTGWSIRSSVLLLQRAEEVLITLREEAVDRSLVAASRAINSTR